MDLRQQLEAVLNGRVCLVGIGNVDCSDDGFGMHLAARLVAAGVADVVLTGNCPERYLGRVTGSNFDRVVFLDAVEVGAAPGSVVLLNSDEMSAKFPQVSTHKISLGLLALLARGNGVGEAWLLGVQPESIEPGHHLSPKLQGSLDLLTDLLQDIFKDRKLALRTRGFGAGANS